MNSKSIQNTWFYRYKLIFYVLVRLIFLDFFTFLVFWKCVSRIRFYRGGVGVRPTCIFEYRGGWRVQKWLFWGVCTSWMAFFVTWVHDQLPWGLNAFLRGAIGQESLKVLVHTKFQFARPRSQKGLVMSNILKSLCFSLNIL